MKALFERFDVFFGLLGAMLGLAAFLFIGAVVLTGLSMIAAEFGGIAAIAAGGIVFAAVMQAIASKLGTDGELGSDAHPRAKRLP